MNPFEYWISLIRAPFSGNANMQGFRPVTAWFSPTIEIGQNYAGNHKVEQEVVEKIASFGRQIGLLTDAVLEIAKKAELQDSNEIKKLKAVAEKIEEIKRQHSSDLVDDAQSLLDQLEKTDRSALYKLLMRYKK